MNNELSLSERIQIMLRTAKATVESLQEKLDNAQYPALAEPAIVHPFKNSVVKLRDNGMIDIFVDKNNGLRIDPETNSVNIITGREQIHTDYIRGWIEKNVRYTVGRSWTMNLGTDFNVNAGGNINLRARGNVTIRGRQIHLNP